MSYDRWDLNNLESIDPRILSRVWPGGGMLESAAWGEADLAAILRHQLDAPLELHDPPAAAAGAAAEPGGPRTFGELLAHPAPPAGALRGVKEFAKPAMTPGVADGPIPREVAAVLYFASIIAARLRSAAMISSLGDQALANGAAWALRQPWLDASLAGLFREALAAVGGQAG